MRRRILPGMAAAGLMAAVLVPAQPAAAESVLTRGMGATIGTLDPQINFLAVEGQIEDDMYEGLVTPGPDGEPIPGAAAAWDISDDDKTYTFHVRDGLKWSNGEPLVAQDFVNGIVRTLDPATASEKAYIFTSTISVTGAADFNKGKTKDPGSVGLSAPDERTLVMKLDNPAPYALYLLNSFYAAPLHKPSFEKFGKDFIKPAHIVSNGAYRMTESVPQSHVTVVKNPNYWNAANVKIDKVIFKVTEDDNTAVKLFKSGGLDITAEIPSEQIEPLRAAFGDQVHVTNSTESLYLSFNLTKTPFDDIRVRQALSMAIDRDALINKVIKGGHVVNCDFVIPIPGYDGPKVPECAMAKEERIEKAKALLADAAYGPGKKPLTATIEAQTTDASKKMAETIAVTWKQTLGIDGKVNAQDRDAWLATFNAGNWDVFGDDLVGDFAGPETFLAYMDPRAEAGYHWESKAYEDLYDKAMALTDKDARYKVLAEADKVLLESYLVAPLAAAPSRSLVRKTVKGWVDNPAGYHGTQFLSLE